MREHDLVVVNVLTGVGLHDGFHLGHSLLSVVSDWKNENHVLSLYSQRTVRAYSSNQ
jgi:hypothetical protein